MLPHGAAVGSRSGVCEGTVVLLVKTPLNSTALWCVALAEVESHHSLVFPHKTQLKLLKRMQRSGGASGQDELGSIAVPLKMEKPAKGQATNLSVDLLLPRPGPWLPLQAGIISRCSAACSGSQPEAVGGCTSPARGEGVGS